MGKLALLGSVLLGFMGAHHHHRQYWWPTTDACTVGTIEKNDGFRVPIGIVCTAIPAGWHTTPPPANTWQP